MVSLFVHALLGIIVIVAIVKTNPAIFSRVPTGAPPATPEVIFYVVGIMSLPLCWYFNIRYVYGYSDNPFWGQGDWSEFIRLGYANPASSSQVADYTIANVIVLPLFTIIDGRRRGIRHPWLFFVSSLFTSFVFGWTFYLATVERQRRHQQAAVPVNSPA
ncbi:DUF2834 domain-containing protein [Mycolicibacterium moriokaense]|uniref:Uncharacterized protein DUF2834 n=1 Tax=Mycolicibacterium moriokaense TaxID=39691 RepID=A0A318HQP6_9MYCO|nr:DUF2834 domain-containing protein [Mycolicibacterium moriokaense]PXX06862.1 uncharacterized protein DUF2834 [Mycolicibacterium moriokaense]